MSYLRSHHTSSIVESGNAILPPISSSVVVVAAAAASGGVNTEPVNRRSLAEADVYLYKVAGAGTCQIRTSLDTLYDGEIAAMGVTFTVQALTTSIDIQALEFANTPGSSPSTINVYARKGTTFSTTTSDWITLASTTSVVSPDGLGMITPRADMKQALTIAAGEAWTIYISSSASNIKLASTTTTTGSSYQVDDFLQVNVGESMAGGPEFSAARTGNRGLQGKLYYRVLKPCAELPTETELTFPFATASGIDRVELNDAVTGGLNKLFTDEADLKRWSQVHGLSIKSLDLKSKGSTEDCSEYGLNGGCDLYDSDILFGHYKSLEARDLVLEFLLKLNFRKGLGDLGNGINVTYIGDEVLQQQYDVTITGVPSGTVLNPIQRDYMQHVTLDFFDEFSETVPNRVTIQQSTRRRRQLRSRESSDTRSPLSLSRSLQAGGTVKTEALVYGIGKDHEAFFKELEKAFISNIEQYKEEMQRQQYLPGEINDEKNFGAIFESISDVAVVRSQASEPTLPPTTGSSNKEKLDSSQIQIIVFSILIAITFFWLVYRIMKDCVLVQDGWDVKKEKLSDKVEREKASALNRPELSNMDKPRQRTSVAIDIGSLPEIKLPTDDASSVPSKESSITSRRRAPPSRRVGATKSTDDLDILRPRSNLSTIVPREPTRGVRRAKSNDDTDLLFESLSATTLRNNRTQGEPVRGVARSKSSDNANFLMRRPFHSGFVTPTSLDPGTGRPTTPTVARSTSNDLQATGKGKGWSSTGGLPTPDSKPPSGKKKTKKKQKGTSSNHEKDESKKKRKSSKKKNKEIEEESATPPSSTKVSKKRSEKENGNDKHVANGKVTKEKKKKGSQEPKDKKPKKSSQSPKRQAAANASS